MMNNLNQVTKSPVDHEINLGYFFSIRSTKKPIKREQIVTFIGMEDVSIDGKIISQHLLPYREIKSGLTYFEIGDILVAKITPCFENGKGAYLNNLNTKNGFGSTEFHVLVANSNAIPEYIFYHTQTAKFRKQLSSEMVGTAGHKRVPSTALINYNIPILHNKNEQTSIARILRDIDSLINSLETLINKKRQIKHGAMQQLLSGAKRVQEHCKTWEIKKLGEICQITTGKLDANAMDVNGDYRFYTCAKEYYHIDRYAFDTEALLVSGNGANVGYIHYYKGKFNAYQRTYVLFNFKEDIQFIKILLDTFLYLRINTEKNEGNTPYIKMDTLTDMQISLPKTKNEQEIISGLFADLDNEICSLEKKLEKYKFIKQGMMQELLTGKTRLL